MRIALVAAVVLAAACSDRNAAPVDSASASDSAGVTGNVDAASPQADTMPAYPPADASGNIIGETRKSSGGFGQDPPAGSIGRDSAYGPVGTMDSQGNRDTIRR